MLYLIKSFTDSVMSMLSEDPVRPNIPHVDRVGDNKDIFVLRDENEQVKAITCVSYQTEVPTKEDNKVTQGSQPTKLATMDYMQAGVPIDFMSEEEDFTTRYNNQQGGD